MPRPARAPLRAVGVDEKPRRRRTKQLKTAVNWSERELLVALRAKVAAEIDAGVPAHALSPLIRQLRDVDKEIRLLDARAVESADDSCRTDDDVWDETAI